jgi:transposase-like protein
VPLEHQRQLHSTNPLERLNKEITRRSNIVGIFPNPAAVLPLVRAVLLEQDDERAVARRRRLPKPRSASTARCLSRRVVRRRRGSGATIRKDCR